MWRCVGVKRCRKKLCFTLPKCFTARHAWHVACVVYIIYPRLVTPSAKQQRDHCSGPPTDLMNYLACVQTPHSPQNLGRGERTSVHRLWITGSHFEFPFNLIGKSTMVLLTGQSWRVLKSWYTGGDAEQELWHWLANGLDQNLVSSVAQVTRPAKCFSLMQNCSRFLKVHKTARLQQL